MNEETDVDRFINAVVKGNISVVEGFLDNGADIEQTLNDWTALHYAVENEQVEMVKLLLRRGADPDAMCGGWRPLHHAVDMEADVAHQTGEPLQFVITPLLVEAGADVNATSEEGRTALQCALDYGHNEAITLLLAHGAV
jgi:cytochrome c